MVRKLFGSSSESDSDSYIPPPPPPPQQSFIRPVRQMSSSNVLNNISAVHAEMKQHKIQDYLKGAPLTRPKLSFLIHSAELSGTAEAAATQFYCIFDVSILPCPGPKPNPLYTCGLLPTSVAVKSHLITLTENPEVATQEAQKQGEAQGYPANLCVMDGKHTLLAPPGRYRVELDVLVPYESSLRQSVVLSPPSATTTRLKFVVGFTNASVAIKPALRVVQREEGGKTIAECVLPPCPTVSVKWTRKMAEADLLTITPPQATQADDKDKPAARKEMVITSGQDIVHAIGGGVMATEATLHYTISNGSTSIFEVLIDGKHGAKAQRDAPINLTQRTRILRVDGSGVQQWEVSDDPEFPRAQRLRIRLDSEVEGLVHLIVQAELEIPSSTCTLVVPTFTPIGVNRVRGNIAITARATVEINEEFSSTITRVDPQEIPSAMRTANVLHAYKFLHPAYQLGLQILKHGDVDVLVAVVEDAHYEITRTETHTLFSLKYRVRNTHYQFLRLKLPDPECQLWSASVNNTVVKASAAPDQRMLVPLLAGQDEPFTVDLMLLLQSSAMSESTTSVSDLEIVLPSVDIPINHLAVTMFFPEEYQYGEWTGDLREVSHFDRSPQHGNFSQVIDNSTGEWGYSAPAVSRAAHHAPNNRNRLVRQTSICLDESAETMMLLQQQTEQMYDMKSTPIAQQVAPRAGGGRGIMPLQMNNNALKIGANFNFEKLLVTSGEQYRMIIHYKAIPRQQRRSLRKKKFLCC